jgi:hypothetical protein
MSRFADIVWLHGRDERPGEGPTSRIAKLTVGTYPMISYHRPYIPTVTTEDAVTFVKDNYASRIKRGSLLVGLHRGGLIACALQHAFPALVLSVFAVNSPSEDSGVPNFPAVGNPGNRVALYSSAFVPIKSRCDWQATAQDFDVTWLRDGIGNAYYPVTYLLSAFMRGLDMRKEVSRMFPATV